MQNLMSLPPRTYLPVESNINNPSSAGLTGAVNPDNTQLHLFDKHVIYAESDVVPPRTYLPVESNINNPSSADLSGAINPDVPIS